MARLIGNQEGNAVACDRPCWENRPPAGRPGGIASLRLNGGLPHAAVLLAAAVCLSAGCGKPKQPMADPKPFEAAIAQYLDRNNMAMALKVVREGPTIEGKTATLTASLQHAQLPGAAVTWQFRFEQQPDGVWTVVSHKGLGPGA
jgi:hypothetical protein